MKDLRSKIHLKWLQHSVFLSEVEVEDSTGCKEARRNLLSNSAVSAPRRIKIETSESELQIESCKSLKMQN